MVVGLWLRAMLDSEILAGLGVRLLSIASLLALGCAFPGSLEVTHEIGWHEVPCKGFLDKYWPVLPCYVQFFLRNSLLLWRLGGADSTLPTSSCRKPPELFSISE